MDPSSSSLLGWIYRLNVQTEIELAGMPSAQEVKGACGKPRGSPERYGARSNRYIDWECPDSGGRYPRRRGWCPCPKCPTPFSCVWSGYGGSLLKQKGRRGGSDFLHRDWGTFTRSLEEKSGWAAGRSDLPPHLLVDSALKPLSFARRYHCACKQRV